VIVKTTATLAYHEAFWSTQGSQQSAIFWDDRPEYLSYDGLSSDREISDEQALFCPSIVRCFDLVTQEHPTMSISSLRPVEWNKAAFHQLVLPEDKKDIIRSLIQHHVSGTPKDLTSIIPGKGAV
jgi:hypothetical protein